MRFIMMVKSDAKSEAGVMPDEQLLSAMGAYNDELVKAGAMLAGDGLHASAKGARVHLANGKFRVTDGPFAETKELLAGFWLIQAPTLQAAIDWAKRVPGNDGEIELRPLFELEDFPVDPSEDPEGWRKQEEQLRAQPPAVPTAAPGQRFMLLLKGDAHTESDALPDEPTMQAMGALMEDMAKRAVMLGGEGLKPSKNGARVCFEGAQRRVVDGPFTETKELIAGYMQVRVASKAEAIEWAKRWLEIHVRANPLASGVIEVRQVIELEEFPVDPAERPDGWREHEQQFREAQAQAHRR